MAEIDADAAETAAREGSLDFAPGAWGGAVGDWGSTGFNGINTGNPVMDFLIGGIFPGLGVPDWLAQQSWGNGIAGRGSSNDFTEGGGASTGLNDDARGIENIINELLNRQNPNPTTPAPTRVPRGGTEGGRRPSGGSMRSQYMPQYRGVSAGRNSNMYRRPVMDNVDYLGMPVPKSVNDGLNYEGGSKWFDESTGQRRPGAPPLGPGQKGYRGNGGSQYDPATGMESLDGMIRKPGYGTIPEGGTEFEFRRGGQVIDDLSGPQPAGTNAGRLNNRNSGMNAGSNALSALASFLPQANQAASKRAAPVTGYLDKLIGRGDIAQDSASINAAVSPRLQKGRNTALSSIMMGNRVPDNIYDISGLGADIGGRQGAQNVNVRSRTAGRTRRF